LGYNAIDLLDKSIFIANKRKEIYTKIGEKNTSNTALLLISKVLVKNVEKSIQYYKKLKNEISEDILEDIEFTAYDKISFLINEFNKKLLVPDISDVKELLGFSLEFEKLLYALFIDIQGRLVQKEEDTDSITYKLLSNIIRRKEKQLESLEKAIKDK